MSFMTFLPAIIGVFLMIVILLFAATYAEPTMMMILVIIFGTGFFFTGTHLWGCFMAGMCLAKMHSAHHVWVKQTKRMTSWMIRIFFACTVAFSIPLDKLMSFDAFWKGSIMGIGPCILTKVCCGPFMGDAKWVIGWAMVGRAEFAYFIAIMANSQKLMSDDLFAILVWALIYATVFAPLIFRKVLAKYMAKINDGKPQAPQKKIAHCVSGHLPDMLGDDDQDSKLQQRVKELELSIESKDAE